MKMRFWIPLNLSYENHHHDFPGGQTRIHTSFSVFYMIFHAGIGLSIFGSILRSLRSGKRLNSHAENLAKGSQPQCVKKKSFFTENLAPHPTRFAAWLISRTANLPPNRRSGRSIAEGNDGDGIQMVGFCLVISALAEPGILSKTTTFGDHSVVVSSPGSLFFSSGTVIFENLNRRLHSAHKAFINAIGWLTCMAYRPVMRCNSLVPTHLEAASLRQSHPMKVKHFGGST